MAEKQVLEARDHPFENGTGHTAKSVNIATSLFTGAKLDKLLEDPHVASRPPYEVVESLLLFDDTSRFWWHTSAIPLSKLMTRTGYPLPLHYKNLAFYHDVVLPGYGPIPSHNDAKARGWTASITPDFSPSEPSWNLRTTGTSESVIRFTIEANSIESATDTDPINQKATQDLVQRAAAADPNFDLEVYNYVTKELFLSNEEAKRLRKLYPDHLSPQAYLAFDFEKSGKILGKFSAFFIWKAKQLAKSPREIAFDLIANTPRVGPALMKPLVAWDKCLREFPECFGGEPRVECMGFDLLRPSEKFRVKSYSRLWNSSFGAVEYFYTLGNVMRDDITRRGLEYFKIFWHIVCGVPDDEKFMSTQVPVLHQGWADIIVNWELKPGDALPRPKLYLPIWKWIESDDVVCERLSKFWRAIGWNEQAETYKQDWEETFPWLDGAGYGGMNYVSLAYKDDETGLYMSLYMSPKIHDAVEKRVGLA
ncbi:aromatic prenyltransferase [Setomelanomma holmii]|uniref:Aromatic prenyltransferase n=1 Tax=Setomelanomma holmii TaxID=210430 RepID=A0A9P4H0F8_9PLEO|nr:aromatic prenyltransferase [Setomelanomma holmii]